MILVTGATGVAGTFVVEELLRRGHAVRALCRPAAAGAVAAGAEVAVGDLGDAESLARAAHDVDAIVHTAVTRNETAVDVAAMQALLAAWRAGPFVYISSLDVYGLAGPGPITEDTPLSESYGDYARSKVVCERLLAEAAARAGRSDHVSLRAPYTWDRDVWVDARDLATIIAECVARPAGGPLNVLTGHFAWHDLYVELIRLTGSRSAIVHRPLDDIGDDELPRKEIYAQTWRFSEARLVHKLGVFPRRPLDVTLADTVR